MANPCRRLRTALLLAGAMAAESGLAHAASVFGSVVDNPSFLPIDGAWVYLAGKRPGIDSVRTDSSGAFAFTDIRDCDMGCDVRVRMPGYWLFQSAPFILEPERNLHLDIQLDLIHSLTVQVVKAEDPGDPLLTAQAVVTAAEFDYPRFAAADSAGKMDFRDLHSFTAYLLTVSAPGRKATSNNLRFHGPPARGSWKVALEIDSAQEGKAVRGVLTAKDGLPFPGARVLLSCRSGGIAADLFAEAGTDGKYAIAGVPAACDSARLSSGSDTLAIGLAGVETQADWAIEVKRTSALRSGHPRTGIRMDRTRAYDLNGRRLDARRAPSRRNPGR